MEFSWKCKFFLVGYICTLMFEQNTGLSMPLFRFTVCVGVKIVINTLIW